MDVVPVKKTKKQPNVLPVYLVAVIWLIGGFGFRVHKPVGYVVLAVLSVIVLAAGFYFLPGRRRVGGSAKGRTAPRPAAEPEPEAEPVTPAEPESRTEPASRSVLDPEVLELRRERDRAVGEMRRLNESIRDPQISARISHIESTTAKIYVHVMEHPEKKRQIRRFQNYFLPVTLKLLNSYDRMGAYGVEDIRVGEAKGKIGELLDAIVEAFDHQLDALFADEVLDITSEIKVLEQILQSEKGFG